MNVLIIGLGSIGRKHIDAIREVRSGAVIYALRSLADPVQYKDIQNIHSLNELKVKPDFVVISNPTGLHGKTIFECLDLECPLFIEKPVLDNLEYAERIIEKVRKKSIITYVAFNLRFHPALQFLKQYIDTTEPRVNEVNIYCGSFLPEWRPGKDFRTIYSANAAMGGGVHLDLIHELDYCIWLFGMPLGINSVKRNISSLQIDAMDYAQFSLIYPWFTANIMLNYYRRDPKRQIEIVTSIDTLCADLIKNKISSLTTGQVLFETTFQMTETYCKQISYFIENIKLSKQPMNSIEDSIEVLKLALHE